MEEYVEKFRDYVLNYLNRASKANNVSLSNLSLGFYIGEIEGTENYGIGFILASGIRVDAFVVTNVFDNEKYYLQRTPTEAGGYEYEWTAYSINALAYTSEDDANKAIDALGLRDNTVAILNVGDIANLSAWQENPEIATPENVIPSEELEYPTIQQILNLRIDALGLSQQVPPMILSSLGKIADENKIEYINLRVYAVPTKDNAELIVHIFDNKKYIKESSLSELIFSAMMPST